MSLLFFRILKRGDRTSRHFDFDVIGHANLYPIILEAHDRTVNSTVCYDFVAYLQIVNHLLKLLLARRIGSYQNEIEDDENDKKRQKTDYCIRLGGL